MFDSFPNQEQQAYSVSKRVNDPSFDDPKVAVEAEIGKQVGFNEFGN